MPVDSQLSLRCSPHPESAASSCAGDSEVGGRGRSIVTVPARAPDYKGVSALLSFEGIIAGNDVGCESAFWEDLCGCGALI